jgi:DNA polymerase III epsilon subunit family exonuclease
MVDDFLSEIRNVDNFNRAILSSITLDRAKMSVTLKIITDRAFSESDKIEVKKISKKYVPADFNLEVEVSKLSPDAEMVKRKILQIIQEDFRALSATLTTDDIYVEKRSDGFAYIVSVMQAVGGSNICERLNERLKKQFCGDFYGKCEKSEKHADELEVEEEHENIQFEIPIRKFEIEGFEALESSEKPTTAVYLADLNFESEKVVVCGKIEDIRERTYTKGDKEKTYYNFTLNDGTATGRVTYFTRQRSIERIKALKVGDSIVCTGKTESFNGSLRFTANFIDYGAVPKDFVPEKRTSKPVPKYYEYVKPEKFSDISQQDMFTKELIPDCLIGKTFVVFDLETTGLVSTPSGGNMDKIIEIGAYKVIDGVISQSFSTFINPEKKLSEEIIKLTGINDSMVADAPTYEQVMPDFFKFCDGSILVGHNIAGFDFKFVDYYCGKLGYMLERKLIDTIPLSQELLFLNNYKLNTVADKFGITFNHHRAVDDAYVTARIFIELIKMKKSLPELM